VAAIAIRWLFGSFTAAQHIFSAALGAKYHWRKAATDMRTIAKRLPTAAPATAPNVTFSFGEIDFHRIFLSNVRFVHAYMLNYHTCLRQSSILPNQNHTPLAVAVPTF